MPSKYIKTGLTHEGQKRKLRAHRHNGYRGHASLMKKNLLTMLGSDTLTPESVQHAQLALTHIERLLESLKTRQD